MKTILMTRTSTVTRPIVTVIANSRLLQVKKRSKIKLMPRLMTMMKRKMILTLSCSLKDRKASTRRLGLIISSKKMTKRKSRNNN